VRAHPHNDPVRRAHDVGRLRAKEPSGGVWPSSRRSDLATHLQKGLASRSRAHGSVRLPQGETARHENLATGDALQKSAHARRGRPRLGMRVRKRAPPEPAVRAAGRDCCRVCPASAFRVEARSRIRPRVAAIAG
jgi:hypothetical protein